MEAGYRIERARRSQLGALPAIESAAAVRFAGLGIANAVLTDETDHEELEEARANGWLLVAIAPGGEVVGFALGESLDDGAHLEEVDVLPAHGRRGVGGALVEAICDDARRRGCAAVTLTTFREIPWNEPFYRRLGFEELAAADLTPELEERVAEETARGLDPARRLVMRRVL